MPSMTTRRTTIDELKSIFFKSLESVNTETLIRNNVRVYNDYLVVNEKFFKLTKPCYIVGFGKAVLGMTMALISILGDHFRKGVVTVPTGIFNCTMDKPSDPRIKFIEGADNNLPDEKALDGAKQIKKLVEKLQKDDLVIVLISGGGSALLPLPKEPVTLQEKLDVIKALTTCGADIKELNCVRKRLSELKGGGLAQLAYPASMISLILSDVVGDPIDKIASGPTIPNCDSDDAARQVIEKYSLYEELSESVNTILQTRIETAPDIGITQGNFTHVYNHIVGSNTIAAQAAYRYARGLGYNTFVLSTKVTGDAEIIGKSYAQIASQVAYLINAPVPKTEDLKLCLQSLQNSLQISTFCVEEIVNMDCEFISKGVCLILAGEPTVVIQGNGKGGRNQHLALTFSIEISKFDLKWVNVDFLSCGTDGIDGPTDAAGAIGTLDLVSNAMEDGINPEEYLSNSDSYNFFSKFKDGKNLIRTGHTGTNVMDIHIILITLPQSQYPTCCHGSI